MTVSTAAAGLGPRLSGILATFPVMGTVLVGFSHVQAGRASAVLLLGGMTLGYFAFAAFCVTLALFLRKQTIVIVFFTAFALALIVQLLVKAVSPSRLAGEE